MFLEISNVMSLNKHSTYLNPFFHYPALLDRHGKNIVSDVAVALSDFLK